MSQLQYASQQVDIRNACFIRSYAKINLTLDVLGRRSDGYHEIITVMQTVDLYDTLCIAPSDDQRVHIICTRPELSNESNLAVQAAEALRQRFAPKQGVVIELHKRIPLAAGLGGGSSNAAAVLRALQQLWQLPLSSAELLTLAASLGSDVPFLLTGGLAYCEGRGERVTPLAPYWPMSMRWLLLVKPAIGLSTAEVYRHVPAADYTDGTRSQAVRTALTAKRGLQPADLYNGLERCVLERYPEVAQTREDMLRAGATDVRLSGSGPTLFAPFSDLTRAAQAQQQLHAQGYEVYLSRAIHPNLENTCFSNMEVGGS
jgi:4-diphosphocytidyl-2-C-methyl-D-erythritol kinase